MNLGFLQMIKEESGFGEKKETDLLRETLLLCLTHRDLMSHLLPGNLFLSNFN
jgi:hypothetical protein